jgi:O-antigen/teichoic acid export membrane protein
LTPRVAAGNADPNPGRNIAWSALSNFAVPALALIQAPILAHSLGVEGRGVVAAATAPLFLLMFVGALGVPETVTNTIAATGSSPARSFLTGAPVMIASGLSLTVLVWILSGFLSGGDEHLGLLLVSCTFALTPILLIALTRGVAAGLHLWRMINLERLLTAIARVLAIVAIAFSGVIDPVNAALIVALSPLIGLLPYTKLIFRMFGSIKKDGHSPDAKLSWGFAVRIWLGSISGILLTRLDQVLLTPLAGTFQLGLYAAAVNIGDVALLANNAVRDVLFSADASERSNDRVQRAARLSTFVSFVVGLPIAAFSWLVVGVLFGDEFLAAAPMVVLLIVAAVLGVPGSVAGAALAARGRPGMRSLAIAFGAAVNLVALFLLVPAWGGLGAAAATLLGALLSSSLCLMFGKRIASLSPSRMFVANRADLATLARVVYSMGGRLQR